MRWFHAICLVGGMERFYFLFGWKDEIIQVILPLTTIIWGPHVSHPCLFFLFASLRLELHRVLPHASRRPPHVSHRPDLRPRCTRLHPPHTTPYLRPGIVGSSLIASPQPLSRCHGLRPTHPAPISAPTAASFAVSGFPASTAGSALLPRLDCVSGAPPPPLSGVTPSSHWPDCADAAPPPSNFARDSWISAIDRRLRLSLADAPRVAVTVSCSVQMGWFGPSKFLGSSHPESWVDIPLARMAPSHALEPN